MNEKIYIVGINNCDGYLFKSAHRSYEGAFEAWKLVRDDIINDVNQIMEFNSKDQSETRHSDTCVDFVFDSGSRIG